MLRRTVFTTRTWMDGWMGSIPIRSLKSFFVSYPNSSLWSIAFNVHPVPPAPPGGEEEVGEELTCAYHLVWGSGEPGCLLPGSDWLWACSAAFCCLSMDHTWLLEGSKAGWTVSIPRENCPLLGHAQSFSLTPHHLHVRSLMPIIPSAFGVQQQTVCTCPHHPSKPIVCSSA